MDAIELKTARRRDEPGLSSRHSLITSFVVVVFNMIFLLILVEFHIIHPNAAHFSVPSYLPLIPGAWTPKIN